MCRPANSGTSHSFSQQLGTAANKTGSRFHFLGMACPTGLVVGWLTDWSINQALALAGRQESLRFCPFAGNFVLVSGVLGMPGDERVGNRTENRHCKIDTVKSKLWLGVC